MRRRGWLARSRRTLRLTTALAAALTLPTLAACGGGSTAERSELTVSAAASLTEAFGRLARRFETEHPAVEVSLNFDSSATLAQQVVQGAPADVLATADQRTMGWVTGEGLTDGGPRVFATNTLVIVTPPSDPGDVRGVRDLTRGGLTLALCDPSAPCGAATERLLARNGVDVEPATFEEDVKAVLTKVTLGEVDAGVVYRSDARQAGDDVRTVAIDHADEVVNHYPIAVIAGSPVPALARDWVQLTMSGAGRRVLADHGFDRP